MDVTGTSVILSVPITSFSSLELSCEGLAYGDYQEDECKAKPQSLSELCNSGCVFSRG